MNSVQPGLGFVRRDGTHFSLDGRRIGFAGTNNYYQMIRRRTGEAGMDEVLDEMSARGMNLLRTWAFQDQSERPWDCLLNAPAGALPPGQQPIDFVTEATLVGLDETLAAAGARGIYVVLTLVNNWDDFGGMNRWTLWRFGRADHDQFYLDSTIREWYKSLATLLANRVNTITGRIYRDDPTIFAWGLTNEARLTGKTVTPAQLDDWFGEMSSHLKRVDPNHMVTTGMEGFYGGTHAARNTDAWMAGCGTDFIDNHRHAGIDYATCHIWPQNWGWNPTGSTAAAMKKAGQYLQRRLYDAQSALGKPLMLEEFGIPRDNQATGPNGTTHVRDRFLEEVFFGLAEASAHEPEGAFGGSTVWMMLDDATTAWDDGNGIFLPQDADTDAILTRHALAMTRRPTPGVV